MAIEFVTIGVYGFDAERFFGALIDAHVDTLCDIRRRQAPCAALNTPSPTACGCRARLAELGIRYLHYIDLAPSTELRKQQETVDKQGHTARRKRALLSPPFVQGYEQSVLADFDAAGFAAGLGSDAHVVALLCVGEPAACHRSLLAAHLHQVLGAPVRRITP